LLTHFNGLFKGPLTPDSYQQGRVAARDKLDELISEYNGNFNAAWDEWAKWINTQQAQKEKGVGE
jgi:hypothetical protein